MIDNVLVRKERCYIEYELLSYNLGKKIWELLCYFFENLV